MLSTIDAFEKKGGFIKKLGLAAAIVGVIAGAFLFSGRILAVAPVVGSIENETMSVPAGGSVVNDPAASGGQALRLTQNNQYASGSVNLSANAVNLVITARGDYCVGYWPKVSFYVDGTNVLTDFITTSGWSNYTVPISKAAGSHTVRAVMRNAKSDATCTRAAYLDIEVFYGEDAGPPPQVDYISEALSVAPVNPETGQSVSFSGNVHNISSNNASAGSTTSARLDVGDDGIYDVSFADQSTAALAAGATENESWTDVWTATAGTHRFEVCADSGSVLDETNETNNCSTQTFVVTDPPPPPPADYVTESLASSPIDALAGQSISFLSMVRNQGTGNGAAASETSLRLDVGDDGTYDVNFANQPTSALAGSANEAANWNDAWAAVAGTHRFEVCADATNTVTEDNEGNNCSNATFAVSTPLPDYLSENLLATPANAETGQSVSFAADVRNASAGDSTLASETSLRLDVGDDGTYDVNFANQSTGALNAGASETENWTDAWTAVAGTHRFEVCADTTSTVLESNESNNCATVIFSVSEPPPPQIPDYVAESLANSPASPITGDNISFLSMIRNQGSGAGGTVSESSLRLDIGDDGTYDVTFANLPTTDLAPAASEAANWSDAWTSVVGTHRFEVCADAAGTLSESDETNNCAAAAFTVNNPPPPQPSLDFSADPATIDSSQSSTLSWSATNVDTCTASGAWSGDKGLSGSESTGTLTETSTYTLTCDGPYGPINKDATVTVNQPPPPGGCTVSDTSGCVPGYTITVNNTWWACTQPLANYGPLPLKVVVTSTGVINNSGVDLRTGCAGDSDPSTIDLILDVQGDGMTYGPGEDGVKVRLQAGWNNGIQITGRADCGPRNNTDIHQDGIQAQGGRNISFVDFYVGDYDNGISTCQGAGGAMFYSSAGGYYGENIDVIRGKYIACNKALTTGSPGNTGSVTDAVFRSGRVDGTDPKCIGINGPATCGGTGNVTITNVTCQKWNSLQQIFETLLWP